MATTYTVEMFYAGNFADMDTDETDSDNENPNLVLGTFSNLVITEVSEVDVNEDGVIYDDEYGNVDYLSYNTGSGPINVGLDSSSLYNASVLLGNGSTLSVPVLVIQATNGDVFISEYPANPLDGLAIQSISLISLNSSTALGINAGFSDVQNASIVCYAPGMLIDTPEGARLVETLAAGDLVLTRDHGPQPIRWVRSRLDMLKGSKEDDKPVQIKAGALGHNRPAADLIVSPQHRILVGGAGQLQNIFTQEAFASAKSLTGLSGIRHMKGKSQITWVHFACDQHEVVRANGCWTESLLLGPMVVNGLSPTERQALANIFGRRPTPNKILNGPPARSCLSVSAVKQQCLRHLSNKRRPTTKTPRTWDYDHTIKDAIRHTAATPPLVHAKALCSQHQN